MSRIDLHMISKMDKPSLKKLSEHDFSVAVCDYARSRGFLVWYTRRSGSIGNDGKWRGSGPAGEPDLRLVRQKHPSGFLDLGQPQVLFAELKTESGRLSPAQEEALAVLGPFGRLYRPRDAATIIEELA